MKLLKVAALFPLILSLVASSQVAVYGAFSAAKTSLGIGVETTNWLYGATGGVYFDHGHLGMFETGLDARIGSLYQPDSGDFIHDKFFGGYAGPPTGGSHWSVGAQTLQRSTLWCSEK